MIKTIKYTLGELAKLLDVDFDGEAGVVVSGLATLSSAQAGHLSFYTNKRYFNQLVSTKASAVIIHPRDNSHYSGSKLLSNNPYLSYAKASQLFLPENTSEQGQKVKSQRASVRHRSAVIAESAMLGESVEIQANVAIGENVVIADGVKIAANCVIEANSRLGEGCVLHPNVTIYKNVSIGKNAIIHSSVVIGSDGFGFASDGEKYYKIAQLGGVVIGDDVEIGAGSSIDCGALDDTHIGNGVKIDNQVQIAHNVIIGNNTIICGCSAIAGSSTVGKNCIIAGGVGVINNVTIVDGVTVTAMSLVNQSINETGVYSSGTGLSTSQLWRKNIVRFRQLDDLAKRVHKLEDSNKS